MNKLLLTDSELKDIVLRYGSPLYLFYENEFRANFAHLCEVFRAVYKNYIPAYSYKTNYTPYVCGIVKEMGGYAEVVSSEMTTIKTNRYEQYTIRGLPPAAWQRE